MHHHTLSPDFIRRYRQMCEELAAIGASLFTLHDEIEIVAPAEHRSEAIAIYVQFLFEAQAGDTVLDLPQIREPTWDELAELPAT